MTSASFASLHGGLLVRKGAAAPSVEPPKMPAPRAPAFDGDADRYAVARRDAGDGPPAVNDRPARILAPLAREDEDKGLEDKGLRATVRLTAGQARQLRLAAALLDRSHQDLLSEALDDHFRALSKGPLRKCSCFRRAATGRPCGS
jgi:hypothetical protein